MLPAIVLAAGDSTRMGWPKAILSAPDGQSFAARLITSFAAAGIAEVIVVTGRHHHAIADALASVTLPVVPRLVRNPDPDRGQLSSLWMGMDAIASESAGLLMTLVDVPMVAPATIAEVVATWRRTHAPIVRPAMGDQHGHPVLFDRRLFAELRQAPLAAGMKAVVRAHAAAIVNVDVADRGCLVDVDTPEEYENVRSGRL